MTDALPVAVVLAAGASRRMGRSKPLLPWGATTMLGQVLANLGASRVATVVVVTGAHGDAVARVARSHGARVAHNPDWANTGPARSLQVGAAAAGPGVPAILVLLADQPEIGPDVVDRVVDRGLEAARARPDARTLVAAAHRGRRGHPVWIGAGFLAELCALPDDAAPRVLLARYPDALHLVDVGNAAVARDIDTPSAYARWRPRGPARG